MASSQPGGEGDRNDRGQLRPPQVVDVVVLGDHEALPLALGERIDGAVELQQNRARLEAELCRVGVRDVDGTGCLPRWPVPEAPAMCSRRDVGHDVQLLARFLEGTLEREVVVGGDDELVRRTTLAQQSR